MRADATHRFEFDIVGRHSTFVCLARTRPEAERVARHAGAPVRLRERVPLGVDDGDVEARQLLRESELSDGAWRTDIDAVVEVLDHVRLTGDAMSLVPVAYVAESEIVARGLRTCECGRHGREPARRMLPVEADVSIVATMVEDGGWQAHLVQRQEHSGEVDDLGQLGWKRCRGTRCGGGLSLDLEPACSVWLVALHLLVTLRIVGDLRPGELSCVPIRSSGPSNR